ncbi:hypothetical protein AB0F72_27720 [Actinoplanes sp. NPDC023936]|uniref:hypothetical protein n=1 Tax=Actinoplanes sp. NPDC023936 TaxID=3154910 RepID=UPI0033D2390B
MSARIMTLEFRRGTGALLAAVVAVGGILLSLITWANPDSTGPWSASGPGILSGLMTAGILLGPLVAAAGAWVGSRERRLRVDELLTVVSRPRWQRDLTAVAALVVAVTAGLIPVLAVIAAPVFPALSYGGGRWPLLGLLALLEFLTCLSIGFAAGRLLPYRWTAPIVALVVYVAAVVPVYTKSSIGQLVPMTLPGGDGQRLRLTVGVQAAVWFLACIVALLTLAGARRRAWALLPAVLAVAMAVPLSTLPYRFNGNSYTAAWTEPDPVALTLVCTDDAPKVCVQRVHEALLPAVTQVVRPVLAELPAGSFVAEEFIVDPDAGRPPYVPGRATIPFLEGRTASFSADLRDREWLRTQMVEYLFTAWCTAQTPSMERAWNIGTTIVPGTGPATDPIATRLAADTQARRAWIAAYLDAARDCDRPAFDELVRQ